MTLNAFVQLALYLLMLIAAVKPLGWYMGRVYEGQPCGLDRALGWLEQLIYKGCGAASRQEMSWKTYAMAMLLFNAIGLLVVYAVQRCQGLLPLNPQGFAGPSPDL